MERCVVAAKRADFAAIGKEFGIDPVIARLVDLPDRMDAGVRAPRPGTLDGVAHHRGEGLFQRLGHGDGVLLGQCHAAENAGGKRQQPGRAGVPAAGAL